MLVEQAVGAKNMSRKSEVRIRNKQHSGEACGQRRQMVFSWRSVFSCPNTRSLELLFKRSGHSGLIFVRLFFAGVRCY